MNDVKLFWLIGFLLCINFGFSNTDSLEYSFFIAGHTYGKPGVNNEGLHPPFKEKFNYIQSRQEIKFGIFLGDIVSPNPIAQDWDEVDSDIESLSLPVYFAVGNHDMENRPLYESRYGDTYYHFFYQNDLFIVLDPNIDGWSISGQQLVFLENLVAEEHLNVDRIFVFFHQLLWWESDNIYASVRPNSLAGLESPINFWTEIEPLFSQLTNEVVFCAGDFGAAYWSDDFMYDTYDNISFIGTGMGEGIGDNFVVINVDVSKSVSFDLVCLNDSILNCFGELTDYQITGEVEYELPNRIVNMYPNPASGYVTIEFQNNNKTSIQLLTITGQVVYEEKAVGQSKLNLDVSGLTKGLYFVAIKNDVGQQILKLIIQ